MSNERQARQEKNDLQLGRACWAIDNREIDKPRWSAGWVLFALEPDRHCNRLRMNEFLFEWKTSLAFSPLGETGRLNEITVRKPMKAVFSRNRENG